MRIDRAGLFTRPPVLIEKLSADASGSDLTTYTFAVPSFGALHPDRKFFAALTIRTTGAITISSVALDGTSMSSMVAAANTSGGNRSHAAIFACSKPTGASGDLVITMSGAGAARCGYTLYRAVAPALTALSPKTAASNTPSDTLDIPARGFGIGVAYGQNATAASWTGLTEDTDQTLEGGAHVHTTALLSRFSPVSALSVGVTFTSVSGGVGAFAMASFGY